MKFYPLLSFFFFFLYVFVHYLLICILFIDYLVIYLHVFSHIILLHKKYQILREKKLTNWNITCKNQINNTQIFINMALSFKKYIILHILQERNPL